MFACLANLNGWWSDRNAKDERNALDGGFNLRQLFSCVVFNRLGLLQSKYGLSVHKRTKD